TGVPSWSWTRASGPAARSRAASGSSSRADALSNGNVGRAMSTSSRFLLPSAGQHVQLHEPAVRAPLARPPRDPPREPGPREPERMVLAVLAARVHPARGDVADERLVHHPAEPGRVEALGVDARHDRAATGGHELLDQRHRVVAPQRL